MRYTPRRRRGDEEQHEGGGLPVIPLVIIVVFAGLLLGGLLAHFFGSRGSEAQEAMSPTLVTPVPSPTVVLTPLSHRRHHHLVASPSPSPTATPTQTPSPKPVVTLAPTPAVPASTAPSSAVQIIGTATPVPPTPAPTAHPVAHHVQPRPVEEAPLPAVITASPGPEPTATPHRVSARHVNAAPREGSGMQTDDPAEVVRAYLDALARGNTGQATSYLASGVPEEPFMREDARIGDVESSSNGDGTYLVTADVRSRTGRYRVTFTVAALPQGMVITDHFYVKPR